MMTIESRVRAAVTPSLAGRTVTAGPQPAQADAAVRRQAVQARLRWGARWLSAVHGGGELSHDLTSSVRPEDVARGELFYNSTCCWV